MTKALFSLFFVVWLAGCATTPPPKPQAAVPPPSYKGPTNIQGALAQYREIASHGGWPTIDGESVLRRGDQNERVLQLRKRLSMTGDIKKNAGNDVFDEDLEAGVVRFQERHGLNPDGVVDKDTLAALNVPVEGRIRQLEINQSRREDLERQIGDARTVVVNIPDFRLNVVENKRPVLGMKVVVGQRRQWQTPLLDSHIQYLILNPQWNVPSGIFAKELIHHLRKDPTYLQRHGMRVVSTVANSGNVDPATIDWNQVSPNNPQVRIVQHEGAGNSLGRIKFMFPNPYSVYLHDTPEKKFFSRTMRALSHGCVRVEQPLDLATYLMKDDPQWTRDRIESAIQSGRNRSVPLPASVGVHIVYMTAWVDENGIVQFRNDVYGRDAGEAPEIAPAGKSF